VLPGLAALCHQSAVNPAAAAAALVLGNSSPGPVSPALRAVAPHLTAAEHGGWTVAMAAPLHRAGITSPRRVAAFLGQCAVESGGFRSLQEDLTYSAARLCQVWPNRFPNQQAAEACAFQPEALANDVYANRLGNGDPQTGDGWRFRGRGLIQITGRTAYERFANSMNMTLDQAVEHAATPAGAADSAAWFWSANELNRHADAWTLDILTRAINGGMLGAADRARLCEAALHAIGV
jgi:putative chitinase